MCFITLGILLGLTGCAAQIAAKGAAERDEEAKIEGNQCHTGDPLAVGTEFARNECLIAVEDKIYRRTYLFPDLVQLRHAHRLASPRKVDSRELSLGEARIKDADVNARIQTVVEERANA